MNKFLKRSVFISLFMLTAVSFTDAAITTYKDINFSQPATEFGDGAKVYFTVSGTGVTGGTATVTVTSNGTEVHIIDVPAYDHGMYYDNMADDGVFSGMFIVTTKLTINPTNSESTDSPEGLCYKIVPNIHVDKDATAQISDGGTQIASVKLLTLFNVEARAVADTSAVIFWNTADSGYSRVEYGRTAAYGNTVVRETPIKDLALSHYVPLTGLTPGTVCHYRVSSIDTYGNSHISGDCTFMTKTGAEVDAEVRAARKDGGLPKIYYVKTNGSDSNDGLSIEKAWQHPSYAVTKADAGDTICLIEGTWYGEHLVFGSSGIDIAPITLTTYAGAMSVLDGSDMTGTGIRTISKSYISISGIHLKNYYNAMSFENNATDIHLSNFIIDNTQRNGVQLLSSGIISDSSFVNFEMYATGIDSYTALTYGGTGEFMNIEIQGFHIHDTFGSGIYWRNIDRLHVNDGRVSNENGSDGISFSLNTCNSVMENLVVDHARLHGVSVHDHTMGNGPCYNNVIRNCDISYVGHNSIDLHSGAYNTLVDKNVLYEELPGTDCVGVYFHNRGAGLIARDNHIYNLYEGIGGSGFAQYQMSDTVITNNTIHDCYNKSLCLTDNNQIIRGNTIYHDTAANEVFTGGDNILLEDNDIDEDETYRVDSGSGIIRNPKDKVYKIRCDNGATVKLEYLDNTVYSQQRMFSSGVIVPALYVPQKSYTVAVATPSSPSVARITVYPMTARPVVSTGTVTVSTFNITLPIGQYQVVFRASVDDNASPMDFAVKSLVPWAWYEVQKDSVTYVAQQQLDASGTLSFRNSGWTGTHCFGIKRVADTAAPVISGVKAVPVSDTGIRVQWNTNEPADSRIEYGKTTEYGSTTAADTRSVLSHSLDVIGLIPGWYHFRVISRDASGNEAVSGDCTVLVTGGDKPVVVPNPYIKGKSRGNTVVFESLPAGAAVRIYTVSGEPVATIVHVAAAGEMNEEWDVSDVAGGVYFYTITAGGTTTKGKLAIIK